MARIKSKRTALQTLSCKFGGMGKHTPLEPLGADDMCNFRILPNGVLKVRSGYALKKHFSSGKKVRGIWEGVIDGLSIILVVVGDTVYRLTGNTMNEISAGTITDGNKNVHFCMYKDELYLLDGVRIWIYIPTSFKFVEVEPYVPLYGYLWHPQVYGEINEEINLLTPRLRVHYYNSGDYNAFILPYYASSVEVVYANGRKTTDYTFSANSNKITFTSSTPPTTVEVGFTVMLNEDLRDTILAAQMSYIYSCNGENKLMLWGGDGRLFCTRDVTPPMMSSCHVLYPKTSSLYFCMDDICFLGDFMHPITTICPLHDTLLVFTADRIWNLSFDEKEGIQTTLAMQDLGCASPYGAIPYKGGVLAVMSGGIYHLIASSSRTEELSYKRISCSIDDKFPTDFTDNVHLIHNLPDGEVWMRDPTDTSGNVWVWNTEGDEWYRFEGIHAAFFFKSAGKLSFACESDIYIFDRTESTDDGSPIDAYYKSAYLDFGAPDSIRRSMRALLYASPSKNRIKMLLETEQGKISYYLITPSYATSPQLHDMRMKTHRYRFLRFTLSIAASHPTEFYRLDIYSQP
ncbi:MAG: hypothetical protein E7584_08385 [Ruminococcaceae bacterium]|nr:hypothetical protein [Oscillospiraceae bacterium]